MELSPYGPGLARFWIPPHEAPKTFTRLLGEKASSDSDSDTTADSSDSEDMQDAPIKVSPHNLLSGLTEVASAVDTATHDRIDEVANDPKFKGFARTKIAQQFLGIFTIIFQFFFALIPIDSTDGSLTHHLGDYASFVGFCGLGFTSFVLWPVTAVFSLSPFLALGSMGITGFAGLFPLLFSGVRDRLFKRALLAWDVLKGLSKEQIIGLAMGVVIIIGAVYVLKQTLSKMYDTIYDEIQLEGKRDSKKITLRQYLTNPQLHIGFFSTTLIMLSAFDMTAPQKYKKRKYYAFAALAYWLLVLIAKIAVAVSLSTEDDETQEGSSPVGDKIKNVTKKSIDKATNTARKGGRNVKNAVVETFAQVKSARGAPAMRVPRDDARIPAVVSFEAATPEGKSLSQRFREARRNGGGRMAKIRYRRRGQSGSEWDYDYVSAENAEALATGLFSDGYDVYYDPMPEDFEYFDDFEDDQYGYDYDQGYYDDRDAYDEYERQMFEDLMDMPDRPSPFMMEGRQPKPQLEGKAWSTPLPKAPKKKPQPKKSPQEV
jgi:hypothetical protein